MKTGPTSIDAVCFSTDTETLMGNLDKKLVDQYLRSTYAAKHRKTSLALCEYCDIYWIVTPSDLHKKGARWPAKVTCGVCGRPASVYAPTFRNRVWAFMATADDLAVVLLLMAVCLVYVFLFFTALTYGWIGLTAFTIYATISAVVFLKVDRRTGDLPMTHKGTIDMDRIHAILKEDE